MPDFPKFIEPKMPEPEKGITAMEVMSSWPLLLEAAPDKLLDIRFTVDGEQIEQITCTRLAVVSVQHDQQEMFVREPWQDRKVLGAKEMKAKALSILDEALQGDCVPGWDGQGYESLVKALRDRLDKLSVE